MATAAKDSAIGKCFDTTKCENVYCTVATPSGGRILSLKSMRGANAEKYMNGFDFKNIWYACNDGHARFKNVRHYLKVFKHLAV